MVHGPDVSHPCKPSSWWELVIAPTEISCSFGTCKMDAVVTSTYTHSSGFGTGCWWIRCCQNFEAHDRKILDFLRQLGEIDIKVAAREAPGKKMENMANTGWIILENTSITINRALLEVRCYRHCWWGYSSKWGTCIGGYEEGGS